MRVAFTGGGTGGHIFPNVAIIEALKKEVHRSASNKTEKSIEILYIGEKGGVEEKIINELDVPFFGIHAGKLRRYFDLKNIVDAFKMPLGIAEAYRILRREKPQLVFAKGGYVSMPVVLAARLLKIPVWLHESDVSPGLANRLCGRFAQKIWLSFEESKQYFSAEKAEVVGNPIRSTVTSGDAKKGYELTGFSSKEPVILVMGGSSGAASLNALVFKLLPKLLKEAQVIHLTGPLSPELAAACSLFKSNRYCHFEFLNEELPHCYAMADLAISRAGSGSIFELLACNIPMILIPLPLRASRGDQIENASAFQTHGYARMLHQDSLTPEMLLEAIHAFTANKKNAEKMRESQKEATSSLKAAAAIARAITVFEKQH